MQQARALRPMGLLEIIDQTFRLYRANFGVFFGITALLYVPLGVVQGVPSLMWLAVALSLPLTLLCYGALTKAVSDRYLGQPADVGSAYRYITARFLPFLGTIIVSYLFICLGAVLLFVGMLVFAFWCAFVSTVFVVEDKRYFAAIWRSRFLVGKGVWAETLVIGMVVGFLALLIEYAASAPAFLIMGSASAARGGPAPFSPAMLIAGLIAGGAQALVAPLWLVSFILLYYDSRIRKEGFDLQMLAREMGVTLSESAGPAPAASAAVAAPVAPPMPPAPAPSAAAPAPQATQPAPSAWQPSDPRLASRMPLSALRRIFVFTDSDGRATPSSAVVLDTVQDTAGAPIREFENRVPVNIIAQSNAGAEVTRTRAVPESVWEAMSRTDTDLTARARNGQARTCVRGFEDPETHEQGVIIMVYDV
jgi:hypothetical protein